MKLTPWFSGDTKPVRPGVYERRFFFFHHDFCVYSRWDGAVWFLARSTPEDATREVGASPFQHRPRWRGVLKE